MKKLLSIILSVIMLAGAVPAVSAEEAQGEAAAPSFNTEPALYVHAVVGSNDTQAWQEWQSVHDTDLKNLNDQSKYFFLPSSASETQVDIYNAFNTDVSVNGVTISPKKTATVSYNTTNVFQVIINGIQHDLRFMKSNAEAAIYINNTNVGGNGTKLMDYLTVDKSRSAEANGAIVDPDGTINNMPIKKIKGRGNSTWKGVTKKSFNITYTKKVSIGGMSAGKKYSLLANFQDDSLSRNRFLYDLADAVDIPYSSDSRYVDFYSNGFYWGSYQMCQKVDVGSSELISDFGEDDDYLNDDKVTAKEDFPFLCEVDSKATEGEDYFVKCKDGLKITIKWPEPASNSPAYEQVKNYVRDKFNKFYSATTNNGDISQYADVDSLTKLYLINELGKNWDSGTSSLYFVYKPDENGNYKFFGSPVWDYDNSLGNAKGVEDHIEGMGVTDYTLPTGWWCQKKGKSMNATYTINIMNRICRNYQIMEATPRIWFESFLPAIEHFTGNIINKNMDKEIYTSEKYLDLIKDSAEMNYTSGWSRKGSESWIAPHDSMKQAEFNNLTGEYTESDDKKDYDDTFAGVFEYAADWLNYRAAWLTMQYYNYYTPPHAIGDVDRNGYINIKDVTEIQKCLAGLCELEYEQYRLADYVLDGAVTIDDATRIQWYIAEIPNCDPPEQEAKTYVNQENPLSDKHKVLFTNSLWWTGDIRCYCWKSGTTIKNCDWPGIQMTFVGTNELGQAQYEYTVPDNMDYVIFTNGRNQTVDIKLDKSVTGYYAEEVTEPVNKYHLAASWNFNE